MSVDRAALSDRVRALTLRRTLEYVGLALTGVLVVAMVGLVVFDWLQTLSGTPATVGERGVSAYQGAGAILDTLVGTDGRVFELPSTLRVVATGVLIGVVAPLVGAFLVHREMALVGETLAHTAFAGVAIGVVVSGFAVEQGIGGLSGTESELIFIALVVSVLGAVGLQWLTARTDTHGDVPIAIVLTGSFAVGSLVISWGEGTFPVTVDIKGFLFGSTAIVTPGGTRLVGVITVLVVGLVVINYKQLLFITFDEQAARVARLNVRGYNALLVVLTAVVVVGSIQILGVILVAGMLVIPAATASQLARSFRETLVLAVLAGQLAVLGGLFFAIGASLPPGGAIIVVAIALYLLSVVASDRATGGLSAR